MIQAGILPQTSRHRSVTGVHTSILRNTRSSLELRASPNSAAITSPRISKASVWLCTWEIRVKCSLLPKRR